MSGDVGFRFDYARTIPSDRNREMEQRTANQLSNLERWTSIRFVIVTCQPIYPPLPSLSEDRGIVAEIVYLNQDPRLPITAQRVSDIIGIIG